jgi:hypothetical protein
MKRNLNRWWLPLSILLLSLDLVFSFYQHSKQAMQGDLVAIVLPQEHYAPILERPFGFEAVFGGERYAGSNRYMIHQSLYLYYNHVPNWFSAWMNPVDSLYTATALFKTLLQLGLCLLLAAYAFGAFALRDWRFWVIALCMAAFFQTFGFRSQMGIIDPSIVYTFFYAFPLGLLMLFFFPWYQLIIGEKKQFSSWMYPIWALLAVFLAFSGPLVPPLAVMIGSVLLLHAFWKKTHRASWLLVSLVLFCLYSLYLGTFNAENAAGPPLAERYALLAKGLFDIITNKIAWPVLLLALGLSFWQFHKNKLTSGYPQLGPLLLVLGGIMLAYLLLLPLGGYRSYRPDIIRYDTLMPVTFFVLVALGSLSYRLFLEKKRHSYFVVLGLLLLVFWNADRTKAGNACERAALLEMSRTGVADFPEDCAVLSWKPVEEAYEREGIERMLERWGIISR